MRGQLQYVDTVGGLWFIRAEFPPIPTRKHDWSATHDDYDGAPDSSDGRHVDAERVEDLPREIEFFLYGEGLTDVKPYGWDDFVKGIKKEFT